MTTDTSTITGQERHPAITAASVLCYIHGVGWPIALAPTIVYMIRNRTLPIRTAPIVGPIRALSGPFEVLGMNAMILLAVFFSVINILFFPAGYWLWKSRRKGGILGISLLAVSVVFWWGFGLPIPPVVGLLLAGLLAAGWKSLRGEAS